MVRVSTPYGEPSSPLERGVVVGKEVVFLARHGPDHSIPPHSVNHRANVWAMKEEGVEALLGTSSVGSLHQETRPGHLVIPGDYLCPWDIPTYHDEEVLHVTPELDPNLRARLADAAHAVGATAHAGGVYIQTIGPRLETKAEIRLFRQFGSVVGMTMASEATLARELGIPYASVCTVDNYCHGVVEEPLSYDRIVAVQEKNAEVLRSVLEALQ